MKMTKKILAVVLSAVLALSLFSVCASAAGTPSGTESMTVTITTDKASYETGEDVVVSVNIRANYNVPTFRFPIVFDSAVFEAPTLISLTGYNSCSQGDINANTNGDQFIPEAYDTSAFDCVLVQWTANVASGAISCLNAPEGELAFTFKLKTKTTAAGKTGTIFIPAESDLFYYQAMNDTADANTIYYMDAETCTMEFVPANAEVVGQQVSLVPVEGSTAIVDEENGYVYGVGTSLLSLTDIKKYVQATGGATLSATATEYGYGTGTKLNLRIEGKTVKSYTLIIFGDANGDAGIDSYDVSAYFSVVSLLTTMEDPMLIFACDLTGDYVIDASDLSIINSVSALLLTIDQTNPY